MRTRAFLRVAVGALVVAAAAALAPEALSLAEPPPGGGSQEDARRLFLAGRQAYQDGRYDVAIASFEAANRIAPVPQMLFNIAQAYRKKFLLDQDAPALTRAVDDYRRFLKEAEGAPPANRESASQALGELVPLLARVAAPAATPAGDGGVPPEVPATAVAARTEVMVVTEAEGATVALDGGKSGPAPLLAAVSPGEHRATIEAPGYFPGEVKVEAVAGRLVVGEARLLPRPGKLAVNAEPGAKLFVDGRAEGALPHPEVELPAGKHEVALTAWGRDPWSSSVDLSRGATSELRATLQPSPQRRSVRWLGLATGLAAALCFAPAGVWIQADGAASALDTDRRTTGITVAQLAEYNDDRSRRDAWRTGTFVGIGLTAALALTTLGLYLFDHPGPPRATGP